MAGRQGRSRAYVGGLLPSLAVIERSLHRTNLLVRDVDDIAPHYVRTLQAWRATFLGRLDTVRALGFDERFIRMWDYYLAISEAGFATGTHPGPRRSSSRSVVGSR